MPKTSKLLAYFNANDIPRPGATFPHAATLVGPRPVAKYKIKEIQKNENTTIKNAKVRVYKKRRHFPPKNIEKRKYKNMTTFQLSNAENCKKRKITQTQKEVFFLLRGYHSRAPPSH